MKCRHTYLFAGLCALLFGACTGNFRDINDDLSGITDGELEADNNGLGYRLGIIQQGVYFNYWIGHFFGRRILESGKVKAMTPERIEKTEKMIEKWGPLAVFLGRFFPFIRTFMPFISGISGMRWSRFTLFSVLGGLCWSTLFTLLGYFFGGIPAVQKHFELVIIAILVLSLIPTIVGLLKAKFGKKKPTAEDTAETADAE